jgi:hypothetical protein
MISLHKNTILISYKTSDYETKYSTVHCQKKHIMSDWFNINYMYNPPQRCLFYGVAVDMFTFTKVSRTGMGD